MDARVESGQSDLVRMMVHYMGWANRVMLAAAAELPPEEIVRKRATLFGNIVHTFNHILVIDDVFRCHLERRPHGYAARNTETSPPFDEVRRRLEDMDRFYIEMADNLSVGELNEEIAFEYIGGGDGRLTRQEILLHLANHSTYHRGFIADMFWQIPFRAAANDLSVFLRDAWPHLRR
ncbi:MAG: DinB family protein [Hyphomicrobiales bacterium]|nr:DinB family protein [Hyphomicrobiales bacterium]